LCERCGRPFLTAAGDDHVCGDCIARAPAFFSARAWACYPNGATGGHPLRQVVQKFKYGRKVSLGKPLGRLLAHGCREFVAACKPDVIVPVPLHRARLRWRGFNQSVLLGREVSRVSRIPIELFLLTRDRETLPQTQLSEDERRKNVRGAFSVRPDAATAGSTVLLVDDVYTSGATVNECSRVLKRAGARTVYVLTLARATG
jgi:ComF family protein